MNTKTHIHREHHMKTETGSTPHKDGGRDRSNAAANSGVPGISGPYQKLRESLGVEQIVLYILQRNDGPVDT